jgi:hypothetical protein
VSGRWSCLPRVSSFALSLAIHHVTFILVGWLFFLVFTDGRWWVS